MTANGIPFDTYGPAGPDGAPTWADDYPAGVELFCGRFDADDCNPAFTDPFPDGTVIAIPRFTTPSAGFIRATRAMSDDERGWYTLETLACQRALDLIDKLKIDVLSEFLEAWQSDGGDGAGKSSRSSRRAKSKKTRSAGT